MKTIFALLIFVVGCSFNTSAQKSAISGDEYKFLSELWCSIDANSGSVVLDETASDTRFKKFEDSNILRLAKQYYADAKITDASDALAKDYGAKNTQSYLLTKKPDECRNYILANKKEIFSLIKSSADGWGAFYKKYPNSGGYRIFSRIGFSPDKKQAVFYSESSCGYLCGHGYLHFYIYENDKWSEKFRLGVWVS